MYILRKYKNDVYKLENVSSYDNIVNFIILNIKQTLSPLVAIGILKYNINILNTSNKKNMLMINEKNDLIIINMKYLDFISFIKKIKS